MAMFLQSTSVIGKRDRERDNDAA